MGYNKEFTKDDFTRVAGKPFHECIQELFPDLLQDTPNLVEILNTVEEELLRKKGGTLYDGVDEGIKKLAQKYPLFIISNCQTEYLQLFFQFSGIKKCFTDYDCYGMSSRPKDEMIANMAEKHHLKDPVYIGDTSGDEAAAKKADVEFYYAAYGHGKPEKDTHHTFDTFPDLVKHLLTKKKMA